MDLQYKDNSITISAGKKEVFLSEAYIMLDGLKIDMPGEYEKGGFLMYVREYNGIRVAHFRIDGYWCGYMPSVPEEIDGNTLDFFGQMDILFSPIAKKDQSVLEKIEPRLLVSYGAGACEMPSVLGIPCETLDKYKIKASDITSEKTGLVVLG